MRGEPCRPVRKVVGVISGETRRSIAERALRPEQIGRDEPYVLLRLEGERVIVNNATGDYILRVRGTAP